MKDTNNNCYYYSYGVCNRNGFTQYSKQCTGCNECEGYISENQFFMDSMNGVKMKTPEKKETESGKNAPHPNLVLGKSKKALKREAKLEAEKNGEGSGFSLLDDPRFKDLFKGN